MANASSIRMSLSPAIKQSTINPNLDLAINIKTQENIMITKIDNKHIHNATTSLSMEGHLFVYL